MRDAEELFTDPVNRFVAGFIGSPPMNLLAATVSDDGATYGTLVVPLTPEQRAAVDGGASRSGCARRTGGWRAEGGLEIEVAVVEELGSEAYLYGTDESSDAITGKPIVARAEGLSATRAGDRVHLVPRADRVTCSRRRPASGCSPVSGGCAAPWRRLVVRRTRSSAASPELRCVAESPTDLIDLGVVRPAAVGVDGDADSRPISGSSATRSGSSDAGRSDRPRHRPRRRSASSDVHRLVLVHLVEAGVAMAIAAVSSLVGHHRRCRRRVHPLAWRSGGQQR